MSSLGDMYDCLVPRIGLFSQLISFAENNILLVFIAILRIAIHTVEYTELKIRFNSNYINPYGTSTYGTWGREEGIKYELNHIIRIISNTKNI